MQVMTVITPFLWVFIPVTTGFASLLSLSPFVTALDTALRRGSCSVLDSSSKTVHFLPRQREEICARLRLDLLV